MSNIEWTEETWQVTAGCKKVSHGCASCYAETMAKRLRGMAQKAVAKGRDPKGLKPYLNVLNNQGKWDGSCTPIPDNLDIPLKRRTPTVWFVNSMSDLFHEAVPFEFIDRVYAVMALCPQHTFQVLTKRPERMAEYLNENDGLTTPLRVWHQMQLLMGSPENHNNAYDPTRNPWPLPNVWHGTSVENQPAADERFPHLLRCPSAVRFLSVEPQVGEIVWRDEWAVGGLLHWMIFGGESGKDARPYNVEWPAAGIVFARKHGIAPFVKQLGAKPFIEDHAYCRKCRVWDHADNWHLCKVSDSKHATADGVLEHSCGTVHHKIYTGNPQRLNHRKGGDPSEWPADLRVREMPEVRR